MICIFVYPVLSFTQPFLCCRFNTGFILAPVCDWTVKEEATDWWAHFYHSALGDCKVIRCRYLYCLLLKTHLMMYSWIETCINVCLLHLPGVPLQGLIHKAIMSNNWYFREIKLGNSKQQLLYINCNAWSLLNWVFFYLGITTTTTHELGM